MKHLHPEHGCHVVEPKRRTLIAYSNVGYSLLAAVGTQVEAGNPDSDHPDQPLDR